MKKLLSILAIVALLFSIVYSCNRHEVEEVVSVNRNKAVHSNGMNKALDSNQLITNTLFIYGVKTFNIGSDGLISFDTYRDFNVNKEIGNLKDYTMTYNDNILTSDNVKVYIENNVVHIQSSSNNYVFDESLSFKELSLEERLAFFVYFDINSIGEKDSYDNFASRFAAGGTRACSWVNTYYISGWGGTPGAAWADYHDSVNTMNGLPGGTTCSPLGDPHLTEQTLFGGLVHFYQVDKAWCCK